VDFAEENIWIDATWSDEGITVKISDDGPGYPPHLIGRIGDPFVRSRMRRSSMRPEYEGMGLGLFIAKTLLERSGAELVFSNGSDPFLKDGERPERRGAIVEVKWLRSAMAADSSVASHGLGENQQFS
jgi:two-component system sensor histidine kinase RegB